jgi:hypothetical protein
MSVPTDETMDCLRKIEAVSVSFEMRARWITDDVNALVNLPSWETRAEDRLAKAEHQVRRALQTIEQARALLLKKRPLQAAE